MSISDIKLSRAINSTEHLRHIWQAICDDSEWSQLQPVLSDGHLAPPELGPFAEIDEDELVVRDSLGAKSLGPVARLVLVVEELLRSADIIAAAKSAAKPNLLVHAYNVAARLKGMPETTQSFRERADRLTLRNRDDHRNQPEWDLIEEGLAELLNSLHDLDGHFTRETLFSKPFVGKAAINSFVRFIRHDAPIAPETPLRFIDLSRRRKELVQDLVRRITNEGDDISPMLINVTTNGRWRDGAALSQRLNAELVQKRAPVVRIVLARYAQTLEENPGDVAQQSQHTMSFDELLRKLAVAFGMPVSEGQALETEEVIRFVRLELARKPRVVLFEGYYEPDDYRPDDQNNDRPRPNGAEILRIVRDDHLKSLLLRLMEPPIAGVQHPVHGNENEPLDLARYCQSRFVVISNRPLSYFSEASDAQEVMYPAYLPKPDPKEAEMSEILKASKLPHKEGLRQAYEGLVDWVSVLDYEPIFDLLSKHLELLASLSAGFNDLSDQKKIKSCISWLSVIGDRPDLPSDTADDDVKLRWLMKMHLEELHRKRCFDPTFLMFA